MLCPKCQHPNPEENRFCGRCGCELTKPAETIYPREGYDESELPAVSDLQSEVPQFRRDVPPLRQSEYGPPVETRPADVSQTNRDEEAKQRQLEQESTRNFGSSTGILFNLGPREEERRATPVDEDAVLESRTPARRSEGIHGPSFLGLADSSDHDFLDDLDEPESHSRRNWFLVALAIVIVLAAVQWRNIRDTGLNLAGSMKINLPHKKDEPAKPTPDAATSENHSENGPANDGKPEIVVNPENNAQKANNPTAANSSANGANGANGAQAGANQADNTAGAQQQESASADNGAKPSENTAKSSPAGSKASEQASNDTSDDGNEADNSASEEPPAAKAPAKSTAKPTRAARAPVEKTSAGAEELARANSASSPETAAKWLWASTSKGNLDAPVRLADMYATGRGVPKDCEQATVLLRSSARRGNPRASARLGMYYATGQCVGLDRAQAWHWLSLAHQRDPASDWIAQYRQRLWSEMSPDERARSGSSGPSANASE